MRWKTICFDLDNTLYSHENAFEKAITFCLNSILSRGNLEKTIKVNEIFRIFKRNCDRFWIDYETGKLSATEYRRKRFLQTMADFQLTFSANDADEFHQHYNEVIDNFIEPFPELANVMKKLHEATIKVGIITNGSADTQSSKINKLGLNEWLERDYIFISEEVKVSKPDREIFHLARKRLQGEGNCLFVGDSWEHDVVGAVEAGWESLFLNTRMEIPTSSHMPVAICNSLQQAAAFIYLENCLKG